MMFKFLNREIEYAGWVRIPSKDRETTRSILQCLGMYGDMRWEEQTDTFGTLSHCTISEDNLWVIYDLVRGGTLDIQIGGFTGVYKGTDRQLSKRKQVFWKSRFVNPTFKSRHGYMWNTTPGVGYVPIDPDLGTILVNLELADFHVYEMNIKLEKFLSS